VKTATILKALIFVWGAMMLGNGEFSQASTPGNSAISRAVSCSRPQNDTESRLCADWERRILDATVCLRLMLRCGWQSGQPESEVVTSHATILDSETLLTHDHYDIPADPDCTVVALQVAGAYGSLHFATNDPELLDELTSRLRSDPAGTRSQARLVRFPMPLFTQPTDLGFESFTSPPPQRVLTGWGELAEVNWEKSRGPARVQWVRPLYAGVQGAALGLVLGKAVGSGTSGGGVFRVTPAGGIVHVGNVWGTWQDDDTSIVALNQGIMLKPNAGNP
jgi:hypothetical protein